MLTSVMSARGGGVATLIGLLIAHDGVNLPAGSWSCHSALANGHLRIGGGCIAHATLLVAPEAAGDHPARAPFLRIEGNIKNFS